MCSGFLCCKTLVILKIITNFDAAILTMRGLLVLIILLLLGTSGLAQESLVETDSVPQAPIDTVLRIGIKHAPPFITLREGFSPEGLSIEFWNQVHESIPLGYQFVIFEDVSSLTEALSKGEIDLSINPITVTQKRMERFDFSQPYFISGTAMVFHERNLLLTMISLIFSLDFLSAVGSIFVIIGIVGVIMWGIERRRNRTMFHPGFHGLGDGMWWSAVTMTTVGYGDKVPKTKTGRIFGFFWMFAAIVLVSGLTAFITSSLTRKAADDDISTVADLRSLEVATVGKSSVATYLDIFDVPHETYPGIDQALDALNRDEVEVVVYDRPILTFYMNRGNYRSLALSQNNLKTDYYSFTYPKGSSLKNELDPMIVKVLRSNTWNLKLRSLD